MKKLIFIAVLLVAGYSVQAQSAAINFEQETIDYGRIAKGSDGVRDFVFTNTGDAPLIITDVKSSCGCTIPKKPDGPIAPGATGTIQVKYDTKRVGPIRKTVTVYTNAENAKVKSLKIKGEVLAEGKSVLEN